MVNPGDLLHGDRNGVTNIPLEIAAEIADIADEFVAAEKIVLDYVRGPGEKTRRRLHCPPPGVLRRRRQAQRPREAEELKTLRARYSSIRLPVERGF